MMGVDEAITEVHLVSQTVGTLLGQKRHAEALDYINNCIVWNELNVPYPVRSPTRLALLSWQAKLMKDGH